MAKQGRKKGSKDRKTVRIAIEAAAKGITPIEVMLDNMRFAHERALGLCEDLFKIVKTKKVPVTEDGKEADLFDMYREMLRLRTMAQSVAADAAPYIHAKYTTLKVTDEDEAPVPVTKIIRKVIDA